MYTPYSARRKSARINAGTALATERCTQQLKRRPIVARKICTASILAAMIPLALHAADTAAGGA